jgi:hypothetical protein
LFCLVKKSFISLTAKASFKNFFGIIYAAISVLP